MSVQRSLLIAALCVHAALAQKESLGPSSARRSSSVTGLPSSTTSLSSSTTGLPSSATGLPSSATGLPSSATGSLSSNSSSSLSPNAGNDSAGIYLLVTLCVLAAVTAVYQLSLGTSRYIRTLTCLNNEKQSYFRTPVAWFALVKKNFIDAPLIRTRHHREMRLCQRWGIGVIPTRLQSLLLIGIIAMNVALAVNGIEWDQIHSVGALKHFRNRTGTLSVVNMVPLVLMAGRNNPFIPLLGISYDSFNLLHRWFGRICLAEAITHMVAWAVGSFVQKGSWAAVFKGIPHSATLYTGLIAVCAFLILNIQAMAFIRHAFYEFFLHLHITLVAIAIIGLWYHLEDGQIAKTCLIIVIVLWITERLVRLIRIAYRNFGGRGSSRAVVEALPGGAMRVTFKLSRPWAFQPGQYFFVTVPAVGLWTSHPFSCAWSDESTLPTDEKGLVLTRQDILAHPETDTISAIIRGREGFTQKLFQKASNSENGHLDISAVVEGPYGLTKSLSSYGTVLLFAGGVGITHQVPYLRSLVIGYANGTTATRRICLVWVVQSPDHLEWIQPWMNSILALDRRREVLRIQIFVTRPRSAKALVHASETIQMFPGRPNIDTVLEKEVTGRVGAMAVSVCGTGGMADDVRRAVRKRHHIANLDLVEESFSW